MKSRTDKAVREALGDFLEDPDGTDTKAFDHFVVDCRAKQMPIFWEEVM